MTPHELTRAFDKEGLALCPKLSEMLDEHPSHRTVRRGCGLTQSTRFLSVLVNTPRGAVECEELGMFDAFKHRKPVQELAQAAVNRGWQHGWRQLHAAPAELLGKLPRAAELQVLAGLGQRFAAVRDRLKRDESLMVLDIMQDLLDIADTPVPQLPRMAVKPEIGSCSQAEEFFLELAHGKVRRGGVVNVITHGDGRPIMIEKVNLGESHSAVVLRPCRLNGVRLIPGSLVAIDYPDTDHDLPRHEHGWVIPASSLRAVYYMRLTTLAVPPEIRERAFSVQFKRQLSANMLSPHSTTIQNLVNAADKRVAESA